MSDKRKRTAGKMPVSAHPAFPAIVALWFAALLGIGTLVLPAVLIERIARASGLSSLFVAAEPPLGMTARIAFALGAGLVGTLAGLAIARTIARAHTKKPNMHSSTADAPIEDSAGATGKRPISAHDELFEGGLDADPGRDDCADAWRPDDGNVVPAADVAAEIETTTADASDDVGLLDLDAFEPATSEDPASAPDFEPPCGVVDHAEETAFGRHDDAPSNVPATAAREAEAAKQYPAPAPVEPDTVARVDVGNDVAIVDLVDRFARALERHRESWSSQAEQVAWTTAEADGEAVAGLDPADRAHPASGQDLAAHDAGLGTAEADSSAPVEFDDSVAASSGLPDALREIDFELDEFGDEDDDGVPALDLSLSLAQSARSFGRSDGPAAGLDAIAATPVEDDEEDACEDSSEENYSSLLAMKSSFDVQREPMRFADDGHAVNDGEDADEAVVAFPACEARNPDAERALRDALEKLQRMSGAA